MIYVGTNYDELDVPCILGPEYVGIVEREWQRYYGYKEDYVSYAYSISVSELWNPEIGRVGGKAGGKAGGAAAMAKQLANRTHSSQTGKTPFHTGAAGRASAASPNHSSKTGRTGWKTGAAGRASIASQLANEKHVSQTKKSPFHTGAAGRASASRRMGSSSLKDYVNRNYVQESSSSNKWENISNDYIASSDRRICTCVHLR